MTRRAMDRLLRTPGVTLFSVAAIAVAIAATTVVYSTIRGLLTTPGAERFERVANVYAAPSFLGRASSFTPEQIEHLRAAQRSFAHLGVWARVRAQLAVDRIARDALCEAVTADYFAALDVHPALGRLLNASDDRPDAAPVAVVSHDLWRLRFNSDPSVLGRSLALNGSVFDIVGVAPEWFKGVDMPAFIATEAWIPLTKRPFVRLGAAPPWPELQVKGQLKPGVSFSEAAAEIRTIGLSAQAREGNESGQAPRGWSVIPANDIRMHESVDPIADELSFAAFAATFVVLLVASTNLANVQLARMTTRRQELAVKTALGANRGRLVVEELTEILVVALVGLGVGLALAHVLNTVTIPMLLAATSLKLAPVPIIGAPFAIAFASTLVVLAVAALAPALQVTSLSPRATLANEDAGVSTPRWKGRRVLIVAQVTIAVILVHIAGLSVVQLIPRLLPDEGPRLTVVGLQRITDRSPRPFDAQALEQARRLADAQVAGPLAMATALPADKGNDSARLAAIDAGAPTIAAVIAAAGPLFEMSNIRTVRGRGLEPRDSRQSEPVIVLSESAARLVFRSVDGVGRMLAVERNFGSRAATSELRTVVGVVEDVASRSGWSVPVAYVPLDQARHTSVLLIASVRGDAPRLEDQLEELALRAFPDVAVSRAGFGGLSRGLDLRFEVLATLTGSLGVTTVIVAMGGLFGLLSHLVAIRRRELGVRMALGASRDRLLAMVLLQGLKPVALGVVLGVAGSVMLQKGIQPLFLQATSFSWSLILILPLAFLLVAAVAAYLPARRAASVEVTVALRQL